MMSNNLETKSREELMEIVKVLTEMNSVKDKMIASLEEKCDAIKKDAEYWEERCGLAQGVIASVVNATKVYEDNIPVMYNKYKK